MRAGLALVALTAGCSSPDSPFDLWDMQIGMPFAELEAISLDTQESAFTCVTSFGGFRSCSVPLTGTPGRMDALVDSTGRVVELTFTTGSDHLVSNVTGDDGSSYDMLLNLYRASTRLAAEWRDVTRSDTVYSEESGWIETWRAGEGRWMATIVWQGTGQPSVVRTADAWKTRAHEVDLAEAEDETDRATSSADEIGPDQAVRDELRRLVQAQRAFRERNGRHADALSPLHFIPREDVLVEIGAARPAGWWARGWTIDGPECVVWDGVPPPASVDFRGRAGEPTCS